jgi:hypothetical protein
MSSFSISCIAVKSFIIFEGDLEVVLVKKRGMKNHKKRDEKP